MQKADVQDGESWASAFSACQGMYGAQNEVYMSRLAEKVVSGLCFNELGSDA